MSEEKQPETKMGRPKKRDQVVEGIAECMGIQLAADALALEDLKDFPNLMEESRRNQGIFAMVACGFPQTHIADAFGVTQPTVSEIIKRIDPKGMFKISKAGKKAFITQMAEGRAMSAISSISYDDLMNLDADRRTNVAQKMMKISQDLNTSKHKEVDSSQMGMLMEQMAKEAEDAEYTMEEDK
jgi:predicted transcriptional regulator